MRFSFGSGGGRKDSAAGDAFRQKMAGKSGAPAEDFNKRLQKMVSSTVDDYTKIKQKNAQMRGGKDAAQPQELSKNAKQMLEILARQKLQKQIKTEKKQQEALKRAQKQKKKQEVAAKQMVQYQNDLQTKQRLAEQEVASAAQNPAKSYFFGYTDE